MTFKGKNMDMETGNTPRVRWIWISSSGIGVLAGASLALFLFPEAAFAVNPTGHFGWHLVGFALSISIPFGLSQWIALRYLLRNRTVSVISSLDLWLPVTAIGIALMILPLWWWDAVVFLYAPWVVVMPMLPGICVLALSQ